MLPGGFYRLQKQIPTKLEMCVNLLMTAAWNISCRASSGNPYCLSVRRANSDWEQAARRLSTCCEKENFRLNVSPSILIDSTRATPEITEGGSDCNLLLLGLTKTISVDLARFNCRLLLHAQLLMLLSSDEYCWLEWISMCHWHTLIWSLFGRLAGDQRLWWHNKQIPE